MFSCVVGGVVTTMSNSMPTDDRVGLPRYRMTDAEVDALLRTQGFGVLSMADGGVGYGVPLSFGYADERMFFVFQRQAAESRKKQFTETTERASFLVTDVESKHDWASVILTGTLRQVDADDWDELVDALEANAWFPSLFSEADPMQNWLGYEFVVEDTSGLKSSAYTPPEP